MKKMITLIVSLALCVSLLAACGKTAAPVETNPGTPAETTPSQTTPAETTPQPAEPAPTQPAETPADEPALPQADPFVGQWSDTYSQRAYLTVVPTGTGAYIVRLHWGDTAASFAQWDMNAAYDAASDSIVYSDGTRSYITLKEDDTEDVQVEWTGSSGRFYLEDGMLRWEDDKDESDEDVRFEKMESITPDAATLATGYLLPIVQMPAGVSGAALQQAQITCETLRFVSFYNIWALDQESLRQNLADAWTGFSADEQAAFADNLTVVSDQIAQAVANWDEVSGIYDDCGMAADMKWLVKDPAVLQGWRMLTEATSAACLG